LLSINKVHYNILEKNSFFFFFEANSFLIGSHLGIVKYRCFDSLHFFVEDMFITYVKSSYLNASISKFFRTQLFNRFGNILKSIIYGFDLKYKVIGLGHRGYFSKNIYLFKIGYSHLVFCFLPINVRAKKKKKKKQFHKLYSIDINNLSNIFHKIKNMRIPDIYSSNGIYSRIDLYFFKKGKKSFML
jgi:ribosomal protein L6P/L9E